MKRYTFATAVLLLVVFPWRQAPQADVAAGVALSVELAEDEEVNWQWTHGADGRSRITGYQIHKRPTGPGQ